MDKDLPDNVFQLNRIRRAHKEKRCQCYFWERKPIRFIVDRENREVTCGHCGEIVDPFDVFDVLMNKDERINDEVNELYEQIQELKRYKPWLRAIKEIEKNVRAGKDIPVCPHCNRGILLEEFKEYQSKESELQQRRFRNISENDKK